MRWTLPDMSGSQEVCSDETKRLLEEMATLDQEIQKLGDVQKLREERMNLLHQYNDVKDAAQTIIGTLAEAKGVTFKSIHEEYGLPLND